VGVGLEGFGVALVAREQVLAVAVRGVGQAAQGFAHFAQDIGQRLAVGVGQGAVAGLDDAGGNVLQERGDVIQHAFLQVQVAFGDAAIGGIALVEAFGLGNVDGLGGGQG